jgi:hypothetical protein
MSVRGVIPVDGSTKITSELEQADEDIWYEVSDEALEAAAGTEMNSLFVMTVGPTVMMNGCC